MTSKSAAGAATKGVLKAPVVRRGVNKRPATKLLDQYKSGLEKRVASQIEAAGLDPQYEKHVIKYTDWPVQAGYT